jgi:hypothetical protein
LTLDFTEPVARFGVGFGPSWSNSLLALTPPTSGTYCGTTMLEPSGPPPAPRDLVSAPNAQQEGQIDLPSRSVTLNSSSGITSSRVHGSLPGSRFGTSLSFFTNARMPNRPARFASRFQRAASFCFASLISSRSVSASFVKRTIAA